MSFSGVSYLATLDVVTVDAGDEDDAAGADTAASSQNCLNDFMLFSPYATVAVPPIHTHTPPE